MEGIITQLRDSGMDIPRQVGGAYRNFTLDSNNLRLYAVTWRIEEQENCPEWSLLIIVGSRSTSELPTNLCLQIKEKDTFYSPCDFVFFFYISLAKARAIQQRESHRVYTFLSFVNFYKVVDNSSAINPLAKWG